ncbi:MAG: hypothetical protein K6T85_06580 [Gorillibacterium sp.]|nr:hypothetical protein [Gorillibacterium sp.]
MRRMELNTTRTMLKLLRQLEQKNQVLVKNGVTLLALEDAQMDVIHALLDVNRIYRNNPGVDYFTHPAFLFMDGTIQLHEALEQMQERFEELKQERKAVR